MINPDVCSCCGEIWNRDNLKHIPLGKHALHLCPDCYAEYIKPLDKIRAEMDVARFFDKDTKLCRNANASGLEVAMQIIDKYREDQKE